MVMTIAPANSSRMVRWICGGKDGTAQSARVSKADRPRGTSTHLVIESGVDLRCRLVHDDDIAASEHSTCERDELPFARAQRTGLTNGRVERDGYGVRLPTRAAEHGCKVAALENLPALRVGVLGKGVQIAAYGA